MKKFEDLCCIVVRAFGILIIGYLFLQGLFTVCMIQRITERTFYVQTRVLPQAAGIALVGGLVWLAGKEKCAAWIRRRGGMILGVMLLFVLLFQLVWILNTRFWAFGDMEKIFIHADLLQKGDFGGWKKGGYPYEWPHQNGFILFVAFLLRFFKPDEAAMALYLCNILAYGVSIASLVCAYRRMAGTWERAYLAGFFLLAYTPLWFYCTLLYGNVCGFGFTCLSCALLMRYLDNRKLPTLILSAVSMTLSVIFKQNDLIFFMGLLLILLFDTAEQAALVLGKRKEVKRSEVLRGSVRAVFPLVLFALLVLIGIRTPNLAIERMSGMKIDSGNSKWAHVAMGLQEGEMAAPGWYNGYNDEVFAESGYDTAETARRSLDAISERIGVFADDPAYLIDFFGRKTAAQWNNPTFECFHIQNARNTALELGNIVRSTINDGGKINILLSFFMDIFQSAVLFGVLMYLLFAPNGRLRKWTLMICFLGGFIFFLFWEAKGRYTLPFYVALIPYMRDGYDCLLQKLRSGKYALLLLAIAAVALAGVGAARIATQNTDSDTNAYYEYRHQYNHHLEWLKF